MTLRATTAQVRAILSDQYDDSTDLTPFIVTANTLVDYVNSQDSDGVHSSSSLTEIEKYLAAHFYGHADQFMESESQGAASGRYQGKTDMVFNSTQYGQTALALDFTGTLANLQQQATKGTLEVGAVWLGTRYANDDSERTSDQ